MQVLPWWLHFPSIKKRGGSTRSDLFKTSGFLGRQLLEVAEADLELEAGLVHVNGAPGMSPDLVDANDRRSGPYDGEVGRFARRPGAPGSPQTGTEGSQPLPPLPGTLGFSVVFLWQHDHWNQFSLNSPKNTISSMNI
jgi:hypothetical protein